MSPDPSLEDLLSLSVELIQTLKEADMVEAMERHPSGADKTPGVILTAVDRCDHCGAGAAYRVGKYDVGDRPFALALDYCRHAFLKHFPKMAEKDSSGSSWKVIGSNPELLSALQGTDRLKGDDHA